MRKVFGRVGNHRTDHLSRGASSRPDGAGSPRGTANFRQLERALSAALGQIGDLVARGDPSGARHALALARAIEDELSCGDSKRDEHRSMTQRSGGTG